MQRTLPTRGVMTALGFLLFPLTTMAGPPAIPDEVKEHVRRRVDTGGTIGLVVGVINEGGAAFFSHGVVAVGGEPISEDHVFEIGSITKAFTGMLLADAILEGKLGLDDAVAKHLPANVKMPSRGEKVITLEHLATHRSSLPRLPSNFDPKNADNPYADYTVENLYEYLNGATLPRDPGAEYEYSNVATGLLGHVLALKAGKSYDELVQERICRPTGLTQTACRLTPEMKKKLAQGHVGGKPASSWDFNDSLAGAGGLRSTPREMTKFLAACMGLGNDRMRRLVHKCLEKTYPTGLKETDVGLGWHVDRKFGTTALWHNGGTGGYHSFCGLLPERKFGVIVLTNCEDDIDDIGWHLLKPQLSLARVRSTVKLTEAKLDEYKGYFEFGPGVQLHVKREGAELHAQLTGQEAYPVFPEAEDKFFYKVVDAQLTFQRDDAGKVNKVVLHQNGRDQTAIRLSPDKEPQPRKEVKLDAETLKQYVGKYELIPGLVFDVRLDGEQLTALLTGQPRFPIFAESETKFFYKVVDAQLTFEKDADGKVTGLVLHQAGMEQRAKKIE